MIYTMTFNPSLDYIIQVDDFKTGSINRTTSELILPGGKGLNVSMVLKNLGYDSIALGFIAGFTGKEIEKRLNGFGCVSHFIHLNEGLSRINVKMKSDEETEINGNGPVINDHALTGLFTALNTLKGGDILVLAGSIPDTLPSDIYEKIMQQLQDRNVEIVVDATKDLLTNVLEYKPFLIKPNNHELGEIFGMILENDDAIIACGKKLQDRGARNVLVSMAGDGAIFIPEKGTVLKLAAPTGKLVNSVGAGDSMVAGFLAGYLDSGDYGKAFRYGVAAGSASAFSSYLATQQEVDQLLQAL